MTTIKPKKTKEQIIKEKYPNLMSQGITLTEASEKYNVPRRTIETWVYRKKYINHVDKTAYPQTFNEADIAYCAEIYHKRPGVSGVPLLNDNGLPYQLLHPKRSKNKNA